MGEEVQHFDTPRHLQLGLDFHSGLNPKPIVEAHSVAVGQCGAHPGRHREGEGLDGEGGCHVLRPASVDLAGGDEHEADLAAGVDEPEGAVVVGERGTVRVSNGGGLGGSEVDGAVSDGEGGDLDGVDRDFGVLGFKDGVLYHEANDEDEA